MAEKDNGTGDDVNLEMPSLFRRRKRAAKATEPEAAGPGTAEPEMAEPSREGVFVPPPSSSPSSFRPPVEQAEDTAVLPSTDEPKAAKPAKAPKPPERAKAPRDKPRVRLPEVGGMTASVLTGVLVGLLACGATYLAMQGCEAINGTSSCGGGPGFFLLVVIVVGLVLAGGLVMRALRVTDPASTSFLAVGLLAVIVLLFFMEVIFEWWMVIAIPVTSAVTFAAAHWVTTTFIEPGDRPK